MTDRRLTAANKRVADEPLRASHPGLTYVSPTLYSVHWPIVDLMSQPEGQRDRQLLFGETVDLFEMHEGWAFVRSVKDGYIGYVPQSSLMQKPIATHRVNATSSQVYAAPDFKSRDLMRLSKACLLSVTGETGKFWQTPDGFVPKQHVSLLSEIGSDPVSEAEAYLGTPYLWGGNSRFGIDCSGLVQAAFVACGRRCPGDSDMQEEQMGEALGESDALQRGDLLFWKGHVAMVVSPTQLIHANAFDMAVTYEGISAAISRIEAQGDGPVTSRKRIQFEGTT